MEYIRKPIMAKTLSSLELEFILINIMRFSSI